MSAIDDRAAAQLPETWDALKKSSRFGEPFLENRRDYVKFRLFGTVVSAASEATVYDPVELELAGKVIAIQLINPGMDYWASAPTSESISGTDESVSYSDRAKNLEALASRLQTEITEIVEIRPDLNTWKRLRQGIKVSPGGGDITPDPQDFEPIGRGTIPPIPWDRWSA